MRKSRQRDRILEIIKSASAHLTADELYQELRKEFPRISLGTVYRNIRQLAAEGLIQELPVSGGADRFDREITPHAHFICTNCGCVIDLPEVDVCGVAESQLAEDGHKVERSIIELHGICNGCAEVGRAH